MSEQDSVKFAKGFGYKTSDVDSWIDKLFEEKMDLESQLDKLKKELRTLKEQKEEVEKKYSELQTEQNKIKLLETKRVDDFAELMDNGKKIVNQMIEEAKQEAAETIYDSKKVLDEAKEEASQIKSRSIHDVKSISALLAEIAKASAKSKEQVVSLYNQIDNHYNGFIEEMQKKAAEIFPKEN
ncbi:hypothetical protein [Scatolibacter rhodanostii]|uniref:hypothetical protein n=1 Tax=Scatolibacter rhodanostii TaxID=2014781 RepID=UPI000C06A077|nr:hypothetical protein [Scatolibacter rhodanostii]